MALDSLLVDILACPNDRGSLLYFEDESILYNPRRHEAFAVNDGIPVLLPDEARKVDDAEHEALMAKASTAVETSGGVN